MSKPTPELIAKLTGASSILMPPTYLLKERISSLISMLENQLFSNAAIDVRE